MPENTDPCEDQWIRSALDYADRQGGMARLHIMRLAQIIDLLDSRIDDLGFELDGRQYVSGRPPTTLNP